MATTFPYGLGYRPDLKDRRDLKMKFDAAAVAALPPSNPRFPVGLPDIWDQGSLGACTAFAILRCHNFAAAKAGMKQETLSCLQLYYDERTEEGTVESDSGAMIRTGIKSLKVRGVGPEVHWPYVIERYRQKPPAISYKTGMDFQIIKFASVTPTLEQVKAALMAGYPIVCGWPCYESLASSKTTKSGDVQFPKLSEAMVGGHATVLNGFFDDSLQQVGFDNSWSKSWGRGGLGTLPYRYFTNGFVSDCWIIYEVEGELPAPAPDPIDPPLPVPVPTPPVPVPTPGRRTLVIAGDNMQISVDGKIV